MPPWVRHQFPVAGRLVRRLRDTACADPACGWCRERHDAHKELAPLVRLPRLPPGAVEYRRPADAGGHRRGGDGRGPCARDPAHRAPASRLCYQIPALSRHDKTGALTVVISPLVALMADQVAGLEARGIGSCVAINGLLSLPERSAALDRVRLGDAGLVLVSPEQLRNRSFRRVLNQREIGAWVLDEAHCLSEVGARLPARLSLRGALHPRKGSTGADTAGAVPDRYRQA